MPNCIAAKYVGSNNIMFGHLEGLKFAIWQTRWLNFDANICSKNSRILVLIRVWFLLSFCVNIQILKHWTVYSIGLLKFTGQMWWFHSKIKGNVLKSCANHKNYHKNLSFWIYKDSNPWFGLWILQESPAVTDKPARRLWKVCTVYVP